MSQGTIGVKRGFDIARRTHVFDAVHAAVAPPAEDAHNCRSREASRLPRVARTDLKCQSHHASFGRTWGVLGDEIGMATLMRTMIECKFSQH